MVAAATTTAVKAARSAAKRLDATVSRPRRSSASTRARCATGRRSLASRRKMLSRRARRSGATARGGAGSSGTSAIRRFAAIACTASSVSISKRSRECRASCSRQGAPEAEESVAEVAELAAPHEVDGTDERRVAQPPDRRESREPEARRWREPLHEVVADVQRGDVVLDLRRLHAVRVDGHDVVAGRGLEPGRSAAPFPCPSLVHDDDVGPRRTGHLERAVEEAIDDDHLAHARGHPLEDPRCSAPR